MTGVHKSSIKRAFLGIFVLIFFIAAPRSLAEDLLNPIIGTVNGTSDTASPSAAPSASPTQTPSAEPSALPAAATPASQSASIKPVAETTTASASATPIPPMAIETQTLRVAVPAIFSVDPRAHSVFVPQIQVSGAESLLICGYTNASSINFSNHITGVASQGSGTPTIRISGPSNLVTAAFNSEMGARLQSNSQAISGKVLSLAFIALSKPSIDPALCNDGKPSNTRTISFRAMNMDLNMVKDGVRLK